MNDTPSLIAKAIIENRYRQTELVVLAEAYFELSKARDVVTEEAALAVRMTPIPEELKPVDAAVWNCALSEAENAVRRKLARLA